MRIAVVAALLALAASARSADDPCAPVEPCEVPQGGAALPAQELPADFAAEARQLLDLVSCRGSAPAGIDAAAVKAFCAPKEKARREERVRAARAAVHAGLPQPRPEKLPSVVVYPLSGGDLLGALAAYPEARNFTLTTRSPAGDPRPASLRDRARLAAFLEAASLAGDPSVALPALLAALAADRYEPAGLRYFRVEPGGALHFYGPGELAALGEKAWGSCELLFSRTDEPGRTRLVRLLSADLGDAAAASNPGPLAHLSAKGTFAALLPSADALAGEGHGRLRAILEERAAVTVTRVR
jgi:hypothetical protein